MTAAQLLLKYGYLITQNVVANGRGAEFVPIDIPFFFACLENTSGSLICGT